MSKGQHFANGYGAGTGSAGQGPAKRLIDDTLDLGAGGTHWWGNP